MAVTATKPTAEAPQSEPSLDQAQAEALSRLQNSIPSQPNAAQSQAQPLQATPAPEVPPQDAKAKGDGKDTKPEDWEQKYKSLQGQFNSVQQELTKLKGSSEGTERLADLLERIERKQSHTESILGDLIADRIESLSPEQQWQRLSDAIDAEGLKDDDPRLANLKRVKDPVEAYNAFRTMLPALRAPKTHQGPASYGAREEQPSPQTPLPNQDPAQPSAEVEDLKKQIGDLKGIIEAMQKKDGRYTVPHNVSPASAAGPAGKNQHARAFLDRASTGSVNKIE